MSSANVFVACARRGDVSGLKRCLRAVEGPESYRAANSRLEGGWSAAHFAADRPDEAGTAMLALLLKAGAHPDHAVDNGMTPLLLATDAANVASSRLLLESGASVLAVESRGWTVLHFAARRALPSVVAWALAIGANANAPARGGSTPLHLAACRCGVHA